MENEDMITGFEGKKSNEILNEILKEMTKVNYHLKWIQNDLKTLIHLLEKKNE